MYDKGVIEGEKNGVTNTQKRNRSNRKIETD